MFKLEFEALLMHHKRSELNACQRLKALSIFSVFLVGVLLDIQQHFGVKDSGAGLLQTGKKVFPLSLLSVTFHLSDGCLRFLHSDPWAY